MRCAQCHDGTMVPRDDLIVHIPRADQVLVLDGARGSRCDSCGNCHITDATKATITIAPASSWRADYQANVTRIGKDSLGTYWPADLVRALGLKKGSKLFAQVLGAKILQIHVGK